MIKALLILLISSCGAIAYRCGGSGNFARWFRPVGIALCVMLAMLGLGLWHWSVIICAGASAGLSTSYFKKRGTDASWLNWFFVGLAFSLAMLPWAYFTGNYLGFSIRLVVCTAGITLWSIFWGNDIIEELGRGFIPIITLPLLLI